MIVMKELIVPDTSALAVASSEASTAYRRHPVVKMLKYLLASLSSVLPESVYEAFYRNSFAFYKALLRLAYFRHVAYLILFGDTGASRAEMIYSVMPYSLVGRSGLEVTFDAAVDLIKRGIPGAFVECGVAQGGCSALMAMTARTDKSARMMWLFDSFQGLPSPTEDDYDQDRKWTGKHIRPLNRGSCLGTKSQVESLLFSKFELDRESIFLVEGWFQETLPAYKDRVGQISLLRIDGDWYESTICCLRHLYGNVAPGGYFIIDDYGVCYGCKKAVHEFFEERGISPCLVPDGRGGILFSKPL
jgi:O-methyltransferase